jgi:hypothetical protein
MGLFSFFFARPYPLGRGADVADDRLPALGDVDMLDGHLLLALRAVFLQGRHLRREGSRQLVEGSLGGILRPPISCNLLGAPEPEKKTNRGDNGPKPREGLRDCAILSVGLRVGLRRAEVAVLTVGDLHQNRGYDSLRVIRRTSAPVLFCPAEESHFVNRRAVVAERPKHVEAI